MPRTKAKVISFDEFDELHSPPPEITDFDLIADTVIDRRNILRGAVAFGSVAFLTGTSALVATPARGENRLGFESVTANSHDTITLPPGYSWKIVTRWGEPLWSDADDFDPESRGTSASQARAFGDNNDGMALFSEDGRHVLAVNNEFTNLNVMFGNRQTRRPESNDDIAKSKMACGLTIVEVREDGNGWSIVKDAAVNRRVTPDTPFEITGPARGHELMRTVDDPTGTMSLGTWANCGNGRTPWGTYLTCEENFNGYFSSLDEFFEPTTDMSRYGIRNNDWGYGWAGIDERFDISKHPTEPNRVGYVVEVDPFDPASTPRKLTALGRFKHENAELVVARNGKVVVYMGDDERGEFLYRYVSDGTYTEGGETAGLLVNGTLYVARFDDTMRGRWLELSPATTGFASQAEICIRTRQAASAVRATTMDRPEWVAAHPHKAEVYCSLTNNKYRGVRPNAGGDETPVGGPNPRKRNRYGQIVRWMPDNGDHTAEEFSWNLFVVAGNPDEHSDDYAGSSNITKDNMFNSPDGIAFDSSGLLWIQTDGKTSNKGDFSGMGNNQMLVGDPVTSQIKRFLVAPREAEVTGTAWSSDRKTMFVGIQHPGEKGGSHFPGGGDSVPRSVIIAIARDDGDVMG